MALGNDVVQKTWKHPFLSENQFEKHNWMNPNPFHPGSFYWCKITLKIHTHRAIKINKGML